MIRTTLLTILLMGICGGAGAQVANVSEATKPDPKIAFLKSLAMPGWGHHYVDRENWQRGQYHLAAEAVLVLSYVGLRWHSSNLQNNWYSYARTAAGVNIERRDRAFRLAVGDFEDLEAYNTRQERARNWNALYEETPQNRWQWDTESARNEYRNLRSRFESIDQQLPALLSLMVVNRVVSALSAYNHARKWQGPARSASLQFLPVPNGVLANLRIEL